MAFRWTVVSAVVLLGCNQPVRPPVLSYPGIDVPEISPGYISPDAVPVVPPNTQCGGDQQTFTRTQSEAILLIDRSGSMVDPIDTVVTDGGVSLPMSKWQALTTTLQSVLPEIQANLSMGLLTFPRPMNSSSMVPSVACDMPPGLDVAPAINSAEAVLSVIHAHGPGGGTPTYGALAAVAGYYAAEPDRQGNRYVILATDGGPNCNPVMDPRNCRCSDIPVYCTNMSNIFAAYDCLDESRTVAEIATLNGMGISTYVIGLPGTEMLSDVLNAMATAGGRPRAGPTQYYSVATAQDFAAQFTAIATGLVACTFMLTTPPPDPNLVAVRFNGADIPKDMSHMNGWDWADGTHRAIDFYGQSCQYIRYANGGDTIRVVFGCPSDAPP